MDTVTQNQLDKITTGFGIAAAVVIIFNTVLTITKELYPPLLAYMKGVSILGVKHHWLLHGLVIIVLFYVLGLVFSKIFNRVGDSVLIKSVAWSAVLGSLGIVVFFLYELFS